MVLEKSLESPLYRKEIKPVNPKGNQLWRFIGKTDVETEAPILWPPEAKSWLIRKDPGAEKDWRQEEKGKTEAEMVGWQHWLDGHEFEQAPSVGDGQGSLACCSPCGCRVGHNWVTELNWKHWIPLKSTSIPAINWIPNLYAALESPILLSSRKGQGSSQAFKSAL